MVYHVVLWSEMKQTSYREYVEEAVHLMVAGRKKEEEEGPS